MPVLPIFIRISIKQLLEHISSNFYEFAPFSNDIAGHSHYTYSSGCPSIDVLNIHLCTLYISLIQNIVINNIRNYFTIFLPKLNCVQTVST